MSLPLTPAPLPPGKSEEDWIAHCASIGQDGTNSDLRAALGAALSAHPTSQRLLYNLGVVQLRLGEPSKARAAWLAVTGLDLSHARAHRGLARLALDELQGAVARHHAKALVAATVSSPHPADMSLLGKAHLLCGDWDEAQAAFEQADDSADAEQGRRLSALLTWRADPVIAPPPVDSQDSWSAPVNAWTSPKHPVAPAMDQELQALTAVAEMGLMRLHACDWRERDATRRAVRRLADRALEDPTLALPRSIAWEALHLDVRPSELQALARGSARHAQAIQQPHALWQAHQRRETPHRRVRLGYLSHNFGHHPTTQLIHRVLAHHDRAQFEVTAYSLNGHDGSPARGRIHQAVDEVVDVSKWSAEAVARRLNTDQVDIMIGLGGHARGTVLDVALWRPCPVQLNYLAFCGTIGAPNAFDVHISDGISVTPELAQWYDETVETLPTGHYPYDDARELLPAPSRASVGLPEDGLVLCGFNNAYKIEPGTFDAWCTVMHRLPGSTLWLYLSHPEQADHLACEAGKRGIDAGRLVFAPQVDSDAHLARMQCADLFLDSLIYNGHTTLLDALYACLPAVSCLGQTSAGRIGGAILTEAGLGRWVATHAQQFIELAVHLATDAPQRRQIKRHLHGLRGHHLPFDSRRRCRELEALYLRLHQARHLASA